VVGEAVGTLVEESAEAWASSGPGRAHAAPLLDGIVESWLEPLTEFALELGLPADIARATARLWVAVARGLLLDLLATGDRGGVDEALEQFWSQLETALAQPRTSPS
jgi:hypothetical protein